MPEGLEAFGVGPTAELCLRVSAAVLARVTFAHPRTGQMILALERRTARDRAGNFRVIAQPFGGSARILQPHALRAKIGEYHFDSPRSRAEQDFRIMVRPADWDAVKQACLDAFRAGGSGWLEADPARELEEEFADTLQAALSPVQYRLRPLGLLAENEPVQTGSPRAPGLRTARIYAVHEARLADDALIERLLESSARIADQDLIETARMSASGRANAALALPVDRLVKTYQGLPPEQRGEMIYVDGHALEGNVPAVLWEVEVGRYEREFNFP